MISVLLEELRSDDPSVREKALYAIADALHKIGPVAATPEVISTPTPHIIRHSPFLRSVRQGE